MWGYSQKTRKFEKALIGVFAFCALTHSAFAARTPLKPEQIEAFINEIYNPAKPKKATFGSKRNIVYRKYDLKSKQLRNSYEAYIEIAKKSKEVHEWKEALKHKKLVNQAHLTQISQEIASEETLLNQAKAKLKNRSTTKADKAAAQATKEAAELRIKAYKKSQSELESEQKLLDKRLTRSAVDYAPLDVAFKKAHTELTFRLQGLTKEELGGLSADESYENGYFPFLRPTPPGAPGAPPHHGLPIPGLPPIPPAVGNGGGVGAPPAPAHQNVAAPPVFGGAPVPAPPLVPAACLVPQNTNLVPMANNLVNAAHVSAPPPIGNLGQNQHQPHEQPQGQPHEQPQGQPHQSSQGNSTALLPFDVNAQVPIGNERNAAAQTRMEFNRTIEAPQNSTAPNNPNQDPLRREVSGDQNPGNRLQASLTARPISFEDQSDNYINPGNRNKTRSLNTRNRSRSGGEVQGQPSAQVQAARGNDSNSSQPRGRRRGTRPNPGSAQRTATESDQNSNNNSPKQNVGDRSDSSQGRGRKKRNNSGLNNNVATPDNTNSADNSTNGRQLRPRKAKPRQDEPTNNPDFSTTPANNNNQVRSRKQAKPKNNPNDQGSPRRKLRKQDTASSAQRTNAVTPQGIANSDEGTARQGQDQRRGLDQARSRNVKPRSNSDKGIQSAEPKNNNIQSGNDSGSDSEGTSGSEEIRLKNKNREKKQEAIQKKRPNVESGPASGYSSANEADGGYEAGDEKEAYSKDSRPRPKRGQAAVITRENRNSQGANAKANQPKRGQEALPESLMKSATLVVEEARAQLAEIHTSTNPNESVSKLRATMRKFEEIRRADPGNLIEGAKELDFALKQLADQLSLAANGKPQSNKMDSNQAEINNGNNSTQAQIEKSETQVLKAAKKYEENLIKTFGDQGVENGKKMRTPNDPVPSEKKRIIAPKVKKPVSSAQDVEQVPNSGIKKPAPKTGTGQEVESNIFVPSNTLENLTPPYFAD